MSDINKTALNINELKKAFKAGRKIGRQDKELKIRAQLSKDFTRLIDAAHDVFWSTMKIVGTEEGDALSRDIDNLLEEILRLARAYGAIKPERESEEEYLTRIADEQIGINYSLAYDEFIRFPDIRERRRNRRLRHTMPEIVASQRALNDFIDIPF